MYYGRYEICITLTSIVPSWIVTWFLLVIVHEPAYGTNLMNLIRINNLFLHCYILVCNTTNQTTVR